jgi:hypothetical protein
MGSIPEAAAARNSVAPAGGKPQAEPGIRTTEEPLRVLMPGRLGPSLDCQETGGEFRILNQTSPGTTPGSAPLSRRENRAEQNGLPPDFLYFLCSSASISQ